MVIIYAVANQSHSDEDCYFLSQGRTVQSATKNLYKELQRRWDSFEYEVGQVDVSPLLYKHFSLNWSDGDYWGDDFDLCLPRPDRADVIEIDADLYEKILDNC